MPVYEPPLRPGNGGKYVFVLGNSQSEQETSPMPGYTIAPRETGCGDRPGTAHMGSQIRRSNGIRRNTAALNPNDAIELSKVSMTNLSSAGACIGPVGFSYDACINMVRHGAAAR